MAYYKKIKGKNYDKKLLDLAESFKSQKGDGRISLEDAKMLLEAVKDSNTYTNIEKDTIAYIRKHYKFTESADKWFRTEIRKWAATRTQTPKKSQSEKVQEEESRQTDEETSTTQNATTEEEIIPLVEEIEGTEKILPPPTIPKMDVVTYEEETKREVDSNNYKWLFIALLFCIFFFILLFLWRPSCSKTNQVAQQQIQDQKPAEIPKKENFQDSFSKEDLRKLRFTFQKGKAELTPESLETVDKIAEVMKKEDSIKLKIIGHSCDVGSEKFNKKISLARANTIKNLLIQKNIDSSRIFTEGRGNKEPISPNDSEENRSKNRRVEFQIIE